MPSIRLAPVHLRTSRCFYRCRLSISSGSAPLPSRSKTVERNPALVSGTAAGRPFLSMVRPIPDRSLVFSEINFYGPRFYCVRGRGRARSTFFFLTKLCQGHTKCRSLWNIFFVQLLFVGVCVSRGGSPVGCCFRAALCSPMRGSWLFVRASFLLLYLVLYRCGNAFRSNPTGALFEFHTAPFFRLSPSSERWGGTNRFPAASPLLF